MMNEQITVSELINKLQTEEKTLGEAFSFIGHVLSYYDMGHDDIEDIENMAMGIGYDIILYSGDDEMFTRNELHELEVLLFQCLSKDAIDRLPKADSIVQNADLIKEYIASLDGYSRVLKSLIVIRDFYGTNGMDRDASSIESLLVELIGMPVVQLNAISSMMRDYMFHVDSGIFGLQSNDSMTVGGIVTQYDVSMSPEFGQYDYAAFINRGMSGAPANGCSIAVLFKSDGISNNVKVDFKLYRGKFRTEHCVSLGYLVGELDSMTIDISNISMAQAKICDALNRSMIRLIEFLKVHPEADSAIDIYEVPVYYGKI